MRITYQSFVLELEKIKYKLFLPPYYWTTLHRVLASGDAKKFLFYILKTYFIYYTISFYNPPNIPVSIFTYKSLK